MAETVKTILVVDDDTDVREIAVHLLEAIGCRVLEASSADEAHMLLVVHPDMHIDLLFTDVVMPGKLDGIDLAERARALRPELKVLYATGFANLVRHQRDVALRGPVLSKPYRPSDLRRKVNALLKDDEETPE